METFFMPWCPEMGWWNQGTAPGPGVGCRNPGGDCGRAESLGWGCLWGAGPNQGSPTAMSPKLEMVWPLLEVTTIDGGTAGHHSSRYRVL